MEKARSLTFPTVTGVLLACLIGAGCGKENQDADLPPPPKTTEQAATQVEQMFDQAPSDVRQAAVLASEGMRDRDYEKAVVSLQVLRTSDALTLEQGMAIHYSTVALERELIRAKQAGDPRAIQAYETLKRMKRN